MRAASAFFSAFASFSAVLFSSLAWFSRLSVPIFDWRASNPTRHCDQISTSDRKSVPVDTIRLRHVHRVDRNVWVCSSSANDVNVNLVESDHHRNNTYRTMKGAPLSAIPYSVLDLSRIRNIRGGIRTLDDIVHIR